MDREFEEGMDAEQGQELEFIPYQNPTASVQEAIRLLESCPVCGCKIHFVNFADFARMTSHEVVRCDECGYKARKDMVNLQ